MVVHGRVSTARGARRISSNPAAAAAAAVAAAAAAAAAAGIGSCDRCCRL